MLKRISLFLAVSVFTIPCGCAHRETAAPSEPLSEFRPGPDAKITENGEAPILDASGGLPDKATVLLADIHDPKQKEGVITHFIAVRPEGFQPVWIGSEIIGEVDYGQYGKSHMGLSPCFDMEECDFSAGSKLRWLSTDPPLLLITAAADDSEGTGHYSGRYDTLVLYVECAPRVLLHETQLQSGKGDGSAQYGGRRDILNKAVTTGREITFVDNDWTMEETFPNSRSPLHPQYGYSPIPSEDPPECWYGIIETKRMRTWLFADGELTLKSDVLKYKVQPGDTREDIALGFFKDAKFAQTIRDANPESGRLAEPPKDSWIVLPTGASRYP
jgi:hypothetical protein